MKASFLFFIAIAFTSILKANNSEPGATSIKGDSFHLEMKEGQNHFYFRGNVTVLGTNLKANCQEMEVITARSTNDKEKIGPLGNVKKIIAKDEVVIEQTNRTAYADFAEIDLNTGVILLEGNARVTDRDGTLEADKLILDRYNRKAKALPKEGKQVEVILPIIPDIDFKGDEDAATTPTDEKQSSQ